MEYFNTKINQLVEKGTTQLDHPLDAVKNVSTALSIGEEKEKEILDFFVKGKDYTAFGVTQAMTYYAQNSEDADLQYELEQQAVEILEEIEQYDKPAKKVRTPRSEN